MIDEAHMQALLDEAIMDCYDEEDAFVRLVTALGDHITFPLMAELAGPMISTRVKVLGLVAADSNLRWGIQAWVRRNGKEYQASLADLDFDDLDETSAEWLAMYLWVADRM